MPRDLGVDAIAGGLGRQTHVVAGYGYSGRASGRNDKHLFHCALLRTGNSAFADARGARPAVCYGMTLAQSPGNCSLSVAEVDESISSAIYGRVGPRTNNLREIYIQARCTLWVMCGRRLGKNFLTLLQHWSGAVMCPACLCGG